MKTALALIVLMPILFLLVYRLGKLDQYEFRVRDPNGQGYSPFSRENLFYGMRHYKRNIWKRVQYHFNPEERESSLDFYKIEPVKSLFDEIADVVFGFAEDKDAHVTRYYHEAPFWMLRFYHPQGGLGRIDITYLYPDSTWNEDAYSEPDFLKVDPDPVIRIGSLWTSPDFGGYYNQPDSAVELHYPFDEQMLKNAMQSHYDRVMSWRR